MVYSRYIQVSEHNCEKQRDRWIPNISECAHLTTACVQLTELSCESLHTSRYVWLCYSNQMSEPRGDIHSFTHSCLIYLSFVCSGVWYPHVCMLICAQRAEVNNTCLLLWLFTFSFCSFWGTLSLTLEVADGLDLLGCEPQRSCRLVVAPGHMWLFRGHCRPELRILCLSTRSFTDWARATPLISFSFFVS